MSDIKCNIPLVSIRFTSVEGASESNVHETHYGEECFMMQCQLKTSLVINVGVNTIKRKGILVITPRRYISMFGQEYSFCVGTSSL